MELTYTEENIQNLNSTQKESTNNKGLAMGVSTISKIEDILEQMNEAFNLIQLSQKLEEELPDFFTYDELAQKLYEIYNSGKNNSPRIKIPMENINFLISKINKNSKNVNINNNQYNKYYKKTIAYLTIYDLFTFFSSILDKSILSPVLVLYKLAINQVVLEIKKTKLKSSININELKQILDNAKINIDDLDLILLFRCLDYKNEGLIKSKDLIILLDSYSYICSDITNKEKNELLEYELFRNIIDQNFINIGEKVFNSQNKNGSTSQELTPKEITNSITSLFENNKKEISEICQNFFKKYFPDINYNEGKLAYITLIRKFKALKNKCEKSKQGNKNKTSRNHIHLTQFQFDNMTAYIEFFKKNQINDYNILFKTSNDNGKTLSKISLEKFKDNLEKLNNDDKFTFKLDQKKIKNIIASFDLYYGSNKNLYLNDYNQLIDNLKFDNGLFKNIRIDNHKNEKENVTSYFNLPVKGNFKILRKINKEILFLIEKYYKKETLNNSGFLKKKASEDNILDIENFKPQETHPSDNEDDEHKILDYNEYPGDKYMIDSLEKIELEKPLITFYDIISTFEEVGKVSDELKEKITNIIKVLDSDNDGYISGLQLINFLLLYFQYKSTKLAYKYIKALIKYKYKTKINQFFIVNLGKLKKELHFKELNKLFLEKFEIPITINNKIYRDLKYNSNENPTIQDLIDDIINYGKCNNDSLNFSTINSRSKTITEGNIENSELYTNFNLNKSFKDLLDKQISKNNKEISDLKLFEKELSDISLKLIKCIIAPETPEGDESIIKEDESYANYINYYEKVLSENLYSILELKGKYSDFNTSKMGTELDDATYNIKDYLSKIVKPLHLTLQTSVQIFILIGQEDEGKKFIRLGDLRLLFISYLPNFVTETELNINEIIKIINKNELTIKQILEMNLDLKNSEYLTDIELFKILEKFYKAKLSKQNITKLVKLIDNNLQGFITFKDLQIFLNLYSDIGYNFSYLLEIKHISLALFDLFNDQVLDISRYFNEKFKKITGEYPIKKKTVKVTKKIHMKLFEELCTAQFNNKKLFEYCLKNQNSVRYYDLRNIVCDINYYYSYLIDIKYRNGKLVKKVDEHKNYLDDYALPHIRIIEELLKNNKINLKEKLENFFKKFEKEQLSINDLLSNILKYKYTNNLAKLLDPDHKESISIKEFVDVLQKAYEGEINVIDYINHN